MLPRRRTLLRLLIVPAVALPTAGAAVIWRNHTLGEAAEFQTRVLASADAAFAEGDWAEAAAQYDRWLDGATSGDVRVRPALLHLAWSRALADPQGSGPQEGLRAIRTLDATTEVLQLRCRLAAASGEPALQLAAADAWLASMPDELEALRHRRESLVALDDARAVDAAAAILALPTATPDDRLRRLDVLHQFADDPESVTTIGIDAVEAARAEGEGLVEAFVLLARAYRLTDKLSQAATCLDQAVDLLPTPVVDDEWSDIDTQQRSGVTPSGDEVLALVAGLDQAGRFLDATAVLQQSAAMPDAPSMLVDAWDERRRVLEAGDAKAPGQSYSDLALELDRIGHLPNLDHVFPNAPRAAAAPLHLAAAAECDRMLDPGLARYHLFCAVEAAPFWPEAKVRLARHLTDRGDTTRAQLVVDQLASSVEPDDERLLATRALIASARWQERPDALRREETIDALEAAGPPAELVPMLVRLLATEDSGNAIEMATSAWDEASPETRLELELALRTAGLTGVESELPSLHDEPDDALRAADAVRMRDGLDAALAWASKLPRHAALSSARLLERHRPDAAVSAWQAVVDQADGDPQSLLILLSEAASLHNTTDGLDTLEAALSQYELSIAAEPGRCWQLHSMTTALSRGMRLESSESAVIETATRLRDFADAAPVPDDELAAEARVWLSDALVHLGSTDAARSQLALLHSLRPEDDRVTLRLLALLERLGLHEEARDVLLAHARLVRAESISGDNARVIELALRLSEYRERDFAADLLGDADGGQLSVGERLVGIELTRRAGREDEADAQLARLVLQTPTPPALLTGAIAAAHRGDDAAAADLLGQLLNRLDDPADRAATEGTFAAVTGDHDRADRAFDEVRRLSPEHGAPWRELVAFYLTRDRFDDAVSAAADGLASGGGDDRLRLLSAIAASLEAHSSDSEGEAVLLLADKLQQQGLLRGDVVTADDLAATVRRLREHPATADELGVLDAASRRLPHHAPLQRYAAAAYDQANLPDQASRILRRAAEAVDASAEYQRLAYSRARRENDATDAFRYARRWLTLLPPDDPSAAYAETAVADSLVLRGRYDEAAALLEPRLPMAMDNPGPYGHLLYLAAEATAAQGRESIARQIIQPHLTRQDEGGQGWRRQFARLAADVLPSADDAADWLRMLDYHVEQLPPGLDTDAERLMVASALGRLGVRSDDPSLLRVARLRLTRLLEGPLAVGDSARAADLTVSAWTAYAQVSRYLDDQAEAERAWRRVLANAPRDAAAANELAFLLLRSEPIGTSSATSPRIAEAMAWSDVAVEQRPDIAAYHDTRARILAAQGRPLAEVAEAFDAALRLDATLLDALLGAATVKLQQARQLERTESVESTSEAQTFDPAAAEAEALVREVQLLFDRSEPLVQDALRDGKLAGHLEDEYRLIADALAADDR